MLTRRPMNEHTEPVERKVQLTGGSTFTVSLPKEWAGGQDIEPGSRIRIYEQGDQLIITRSQRAPGEQTHETTIEASGRDSASLVLSVGSAYIAGCDEIHVEGLQRSDQHRAITRAVRGFVGLEVLTETESSLRARTMLDVGDLSPEQTLAQLERTALEMHREALSTVAGADEERARQIARQDDDVDRLFALISRGFQQSLVDPAVTVGNGTLSPFEYYMAARQLERIADHAEKIATIASRLENEPPANLSAQLESLGEQAQTIVRDALSGLLDASDDAVFDTVISEAATLRTELATLDEQLHERNLADGYLLGLVVDSLVRTVQYGLNITETGLQARHRQKR